MPGPLAIRTGVAPRHGLPERARLVDTATAVAQAVAGAAVDGGVAAKLTADEIDEAIDRTRWVPKY